MRDSLRQNVELLIANDEVMRKAARRSFPEMSRLASLVMTMHGRTADAASIRACRKLVKTRCCLTSLFRGLLEPVVVARMSMADDAVAYFEEVSAVFETLRKGTKGESLSTMLMNSLAQILTCSRLVASPLTRSPSTFALLEGVETRTGNNGHEVHPAKTLPDAIGYLRLLAQMGLIVREHLLDRFDILLRFVFGELCLADRGNDLAHDLLYVGISELHTDLLSLRDSR